MIAVYLAFAYTSPLAATLRPVSSARASPTQSSPSANSVAFSQVRESFSGCVSTPPAPTLSTEAILPFAETKPSVPPTSRVQP